MKKRIIALGLLWCLSAVMLQAARVDTVLVRSAAMNKDVKVVYVLPDKAIGKQACPVVYLYLEEFVSCCKALFAGVAGQPACTVVKVGVGGSNRLRIALYHFFEFDFGERSGGVG